MVKDPILDELTGTVCCDYAEEPIVNGWWVRYAMAGEIEAQRRERGIIEIIMTRAFQDHWAGVTEAS